MSQNPEQITENPSNTQESSHQATVYAEPIINLGGLSVTNSLISGWLTVFFLVILSLVIRKNLKEIPGRLQSVFELLLEGALDLLDQITSDRKKSLKILPISITVFIFILISNWLGIMPGFGSIGFLESHQGQSVFVPLLRGATADINLTLTLSLLTVIGANLFAIASLGVWKSLNKYINLIALGEIFKKIKRDPTILIISPITFFVGLLEIIGEMAKVASLSFRLFGNVFAGEVLLASMGAIMAVGLPIPFIFLEVIVGLIQAFIFATLTAVYFTIAATDHNNHEEVHDQEPHVQKEILVRA